MLQGKTYKQDTTCGNGKPLQASHSTAHARPHLGIVCCQPVHQACLRILYKLVAAPKQALELGQELSVQLV
jgi:hypothetical protein